jgi:hypothetical protein
MDDTRFDEVAKRLGAGLRRREALRLLAGGAVGTLLGLRGGDALAQEADEEDDGAAVEAGKGKNRNNKLKARRRRKRNNRRRANNTPPVAPPPPPPATCAALGNLCALEVCCPGADACESACFAGAGTFYCSPRVCCVRTGKACTNSAQCCGGASNCVSGVCT